MVDSIDPSEIRIDDDTVERNKYLGPFQHSEQNNINPTSGRVGMEKVLSGLFAPQTGTDKPRSSPQGTNGQGIGKEQGQS